MASSNAARIAALQEQIDAIGGGVARQRVRLPFGCREIDDRIGGGLSFGAIHEIAGGGSDAVNGAAAALFAAGIASRANGPVVWCYVRDDLFFPALAHVGLDMDRVIFVQSDNEEGAMDNAEEAISFGGVSVVVSELVRLPMVASRRLQLAAEKKGTMGLIVRRWRRQSEATDYGQPTASATRWRVSIIPSEPLPVDGLGRPRWMVELMRARAGECFNVVVGACDDQGRIEVVKDNHGLDHARFA
ncbi:ImuA family protein [Shinella sp. M31]|uniref:ImuA family protein n=1 Tax=Shinella sp. M31 TaxID=3368615 RepID=UPI003BA1A72A